MRAGALRLLAALAFLGGGGAVAEGAVSVPHVLLDNHNNLRNVERLRVVDEAGHKRRAAAERAAAARAAAEERQKLEEARQEEAMKKADASVEAEESEESAEPPEEEEEEEESSGEAEPEEESSEEAGGAEEAEPSSSSSSSSASAPESTVFAGIDLAKSNLFCVGGKEERWARGKPHPKFATSRVWCPHNTGSCCTFANACCPEGTRCARGDLPDRARCVKFKGQYVPKWKF